MARKMGNEGNVAEHEQSLSEAAREAEESGDSIVEYSSDISAQEAPVPLPARDYEAEIRKGEIAIGKESGKEYFLITLFVAPEQYPHDFTEGEPDGTTLLYRRLPKKDTPSGRFAMRRFYESMGLAPPGSKVNMADWTGKKVKLTVTHEKYEDEMRATAARISRL